MEATLDIMFNQKIIAIIRQIDAKYIVETAQALLAGGICLMEVTFDQNNRAGMDNTIRCFDLLNREMKNNIIMGAGTVISEEQVQIAYDYGAKFIISPNTNAAVIQKTKALGLVSMPGAITPSEIVSAYEAGADIVKIFPAGVWGDSYIKAVRAPLSHIPMAVVGGIHENNISQFLACGVSVFGIGGNLVDKRRIEKGEFAVITERARALCNHVCHEVWVHN